MVLVVGEIPQATNPMGTTKQGIVDNFKSINESNA
jgi:hypothetical protein